MIKWIVEVFIMKLGIVGSGMIVGDLLSFIEQIPEIELVHISGTKRVKKN